MSAIQCLHPDDIHGLFIVALLKGRLDDALSLYHDDAAFVPGPDREAVYGCSAILEQLQKFQQIAASMELVSKSVYRAGGIAQVVMAWRVKGEAEVHTAMDVLIETTEGHWQFLIDNPYGV